MRTLSYTVERQNRRGKTVRKSVKNKETERTLTCRHSSTYGQPQPIRRRVCRCFNYRDTQGARSFTVHKCLASCSIGTAFVDDQRLRFSCALHATRPHGTISFSRFHVMRGSRVNIGKSSRSVRLVGLVGRLSPTRL